MIKYIFAVTMTLLATQVLAETTTCTLIAGDAPWESLTVTLSDNNTDVTLESTFNIDAAGVDASTPLSITDTFSTNEDTGSTEFSVVINETATLSFRLTSHDNGVSMYSEWFGDMYTWTAFYDCQ